MTTPSTDLPPELLDRVLHDLAAVDERVRRRIGDLVDSELGQWFDGRSDLSVEEVLTVYRERALGGGKRLRPAFAYWAYEGLGGDPDAPAILDVAAAVELLHTFALIHDDVMDEADTRRGAPTVHVAYGARHRSLGLHGDHDHYGKSIAVLMGDLAFAHAALLMSEAPPACRPVFYAMCADLMVGQYLDIESSARGPIAGSPIADQVTELKTARYTVEGPLLLGAAAVGEVEVDDVAPYFRRYARPLGQAFQLRDDLLGAFGDPEKTGKPVGSDLIHGKVTRLLEVGLARCDPADRLVLERLGTARHEADDLARSLEILETCGARVEIEGLIDRLVGEAVEALDGAPLSPEVRPALIGAAHLIAHRDH